MDDVAGEVALLPERFHHQLLQVAAEQLKPVAVGQDHHVLGALAVALVMPGPGQHRGRVGAEVPDPRGRVHRAGAGEEGVDVDALQRGGQQTHDRRLRSPAADPIPHRETFQEPFLDGEPVEFAPRTGHRDRVWAEGEPPRSERSTRLEHPVAGLRCAARFRDHDNERVGEMVAEPAQDTLDPVGVGVVEERGPHLVVTSTEGVGDELRPERRPADPDHEQPLETPACGWLDRSVVDGGGKGRDAVERVADRAGKFGVGGEFGRAEPVVPDHPVLVGVGDRPGLEGVHRVERSIERPGEIAGKPIGQVHSAGVEPEPEVG